MLVYGKYECFAMHMLYVCILCASCGSYQSCILQDLPFVNAVAVSNFIMCSGLCTSTEML